jgi:ABC-type transport system involved in multi-copper enzyme maturation permease subunit
MSTILRAELRKLRHTRSLLAVPVAGAVLAVAGAVVLLVIGKPADIPGTLSAYGPLRFGPTNFGLLLVVFGVRVVADETQHRTLSGTFVRTPDRRRVLAAKALLAGATAAVFTLVVYALVIPITVAGLAVRDLPMTYDLWDTTALLGRVTVAVVLLTTFGVAVGAAVRNRTGALVAVLVWFALAEDVVGGVLRIERFLPSAAFRSLVSADASSPTPAATAVLLLLVLATVTACAAAHSTRRDVL